MHNATDIPNTKTEIEAKFTLPSPRALKKLLQCMAEESGASSLFAEIYQHEYVIRKKGSPILLAHPRTCYYDTRDQDFSQKGISLRSRYTFVNNTPRPYIQHCVKGHATEFNGNSGAAPRHEDEVLNDQRTFLRESFNDPTTLALLQGDHVNNLGLHFETDVPRNFIGYTVEINGKKAVFEIAFDEISYRKPVNKDGHKALETFFNQNEVETEYFHPIRDDGHPTRTAKKMGLQPLNNDEINDGMEKTIEQLSLCAEKNKIDITPEKASKAQRGFFELNSQGGGIFVPQSHQDIELYLPEVSEPL